jgi:hypothetical protein
MMLLPHERRGQAPGGEALDHRQCLLRAEAEASSLDGPGKAVEPSGGQGIKMRHGDSICPIDLESGREEHGITEGGGGVEHCAAA